MSPRTWAGHVRLGDSVSLGYGKALFPYSSQSRGRAVLIGSWSAAISSPWKTSILEGRLLGTQETSRESEIYQKHKAPPSPRLRKREGWAAAEFRLVEAPGSGDWGSPWRAHAFSVPGVASRLGLSDAAAVEFSMLL